jgi:hypothetical protein
MSANDPKRTWDRAADPYTFGYGAALTSSNIRQLPGPICDISARCWWVSRSTGVGLEDLFKLLAFDAADRDPKGTSPALFTHRLAVAQLWEKPSAVTTFCHRERERAISSSTLHSPPPANARYRNTKQNRIAN